MSNGSSKISISSAYLGEPESVRKPPVQKVNSIGVDKRAAVTVPVVKHVRDDRAELVAPEYAAAGLFAAVPASNQNIFQRNAMLFAALMIAVLAILLTITTSLLLSGNKLQAMLPEEPSTGSYRIAQRDYPTTLTTQFYGIPRAIEHMPEGYIGTLQSPDKIQLGQRLITPG
jgi:hypothetical protein